MKVYFVRGMDGIAPDEIVRVEQQLCNAVAALGMELINPYRSNDPRRGPISGICNIVEEDLARIKDSNIIIADLSLPDRSYMGAVFEIKEAYELGKPVYVWVGRSGNGERVWLQYYATAICTTMADVIEIVRLGHTRSGQDENASATSAYYKDIAPFYDSNTRSGCLLRESASSQRLRDYVGEAAALRAWAAGLSLKGTVVDLGSGTGRWVKTWLSAAGRVICVDCVAAMLAISREQNREERVEHVLGDIHNAHWLEGFLSGIDDLGAIVLGFVLSGLTQTQEALFLGTLCGSVARNTTLVVMDNQSSLFSTQDCFSRMEVQKRTLPETGKVIRLLKRNLLAPDLRRILKAWGRDPTYYCTGSFFSAGYGLRGETQ